MRIITKKIFFLFLICLSYSLFSQNRAVSITLPVISLLDVEPAGNFNLNFTAPTEAGNQLTNPATNDSKWINYTSAMSSTATSRTVTVYLSQTIPGIDIKLNVSAASGGGGVLGTTSGQVTLSTNPVVIISGIRGAFTGSGTNFGHKLTFSAVTGNYSNITANSSSVNVIYTISD